MGRRERLDGAPRDPEREATLDGQGDEERGPPEGREPRERELLPVGLPREMPPERRRAYRAVLAYFLAVVAALMWPVYPLAAGIRPRILGVPFDLAYLVILLLGSFAVLLGLYLWEDRRYGDGGDGDA